MDGVTTFTLGFHDTFFRLSYFRLGDACSVISQSHSNLARVDSIRSTCKLIAYMWFF